MFRRSSNAARNRRADAVNRFDEASLFAEIENWVHSERPLLGELLLNATAIGPDDLTGALREQHERGGRLGDILLRALRINERQLAEALSRQFEIPLADLLHETPEPEALDRVGGDLARRHHVVPLRVIDDRVQIVTADPLDVDAIRELTEHCQRIALMVGTWTDIQHAIDTNYDELRDAQIHIQAFEIVDAGEGVPETDNLAQVDEDAPIVQVVNRIITQGVRRRASDIHIEPAEHDIRVRFRVDGAMSEAIRLPARMGSPLASRIKVMAELNIVERRRPQDGQFSITVDGRPVDVRTSVVATVHGEKIVLRLLDKTRSLISLAELGMPKAIIPAYLKIVKAPLGMLLCTGPTGSGKTTTLYATLAEVNDPTKNVVTIEDPVEYQFEGVNQMQISESSGITFADGLRGILRQDPDVILLGEIRDIETAMIAMQAALTGHFVLSSLHAVDAVSALHRFTDMGIEPFLVASAVNGVIGQRLLRRICDSCKQPYRPPSDQVRLVAAQLGTNDASFAKGEGCNACGGSGFRGRIGVYELLQVTDRIRELVVAKETSAVMRKVAVQEGMRTMQVEAFQLVANGITTVEEVIRSVYAPGVDLDEEIMGELMPAKLQLDPGKGMLEDSGQRPGDHAPIPAPPVSGNGHHDEPADPTDRRTGSVGSAAVTEPDEGSAAAMRTWEVGA